MKRTTDAGPLERRMAALDLDPYELGCAEAALVGDLQRRCVKCGSRLRCLDDLAREAEGSPSVRDRRGWLEYCPNAQVLEMQRRLEDCKQAVLKYSFPYFG